MKNTPPVSESVFPLSLKLTLIGGGVLIMVLLIFTVCSVSNALRAVSSPPTTTEINAETVSVSSFPSGEGSSAAVPDNSLATAHTAGRPPTLATEFEIVRQREQARMETIAALKREAQERAGTNALSREELKKLEQFDSYIQ